MSAAPVVLEIGYNWNHPKILQAYYEPYSIRLRISQGHDIMAKFGYEMDGFFVEPVEKDVSTSTCGQKRGATPTPCNQCATLDSSTDSPSLDFTSEHYIASNVERYIERLKGREYEAVLIGFSIRLGSDRVETVLFERIMNATREYAPRAKIAFNWSPSSTLEAFKRVVPSSIEIF